MTLPSESAEPAPVPSRYRLHPEVPLTALGDTSPFEGRLLHGIAGWGTRGGHLRGIMSHTRMTDRDLGADHRDEAERRGQALDNLRRLVHALCRRGLVQALDGADPPRPIDVGAPGPADVAPEAVVMHGTPPGPISPECTRCGVPLDVGEDGACSDMTACAERCQVIETASRPVL